MGVISRTSKLLLLLLLGTATVLAYLSSSWAALYLSTDIPIAIGDNVFDDRDVIIYEPPNFSLFFSGETLGVPRGTNLRALSFSGSNFLFSLDTPAMLDGSRIVFTERDLILYDGISFSKWLDGSAIGIPDGAALNAGAALGDGSVIFSLDIPVNLLGTDFKSNDLIRYDGSTFGLYFSGSGNGIPNSASIDAVWVGNLGEILFSLDIPCSVNGLDVKDKDILRWSAGSASLYFDGSMAKLPANVNVDSVFLAADSSLILALPFEDDDGITSDSSGNGNNGIVQGAVFSAGGGVCSSGAYSFDWTSQDKIQIPYLSSQEATDALTLEAWIFPIAWDNTYFLYNRIVSKYPAYLLRGVGGVAHFNILTQNHGFQDVMDSVVMSLNEWHYVVGTFDGQILNLYVDGVLKDTRDIGERDTIITNSNSIYIGEWPLLNEGFTGMVDNVTMYKRARVQAEIEATYASISPCP